MSTRQSAKNKPVILAVVGESGSGKTTLAKFLEDQYNIHDIVSYTTRPMRDGEVQNVDHKFVNETGDVRDKFDDIMAWTEFGGYQYWTRRSQFNGNINTYVIDEKGLVELEEKWSDEFDIVPVKIVRSDNPVDNDRKKRDEDRIKYDRYQIIIINDGSLDEFLEKSSDVIRNFFSSKVIAVDFDGTCVTHAYPYTGVSIGAERVLRKLYDRGHKIVVNTMRWGDMLNPVKDWFDEIGVELYGINKNPTQNSWTESPKCYAHLYIDDAAVGTPLVYRSGERPYVDWKKMTEYLKNHGYIEQTWEY